MIRINLLPIKDTIRKETSKRQLILFGVFMLALLVVFYFMYATKASSRDSLQQENASSASSIEVLKKQVADVEKLTQEKQTLKDQIDVLDGLESGRAGPVRILDEIQIILSQPRNELDRLNYEKKRWNSKWDPSRLWFNTFSERGGQFRLTGGARSSEDVAEFLQRLSTSPFFGDVRLLSVGQKNAKKFEFSSFELRGNLTYSVKPKSKDKGDEKEKKDAKKGKKNAKKGKK